MRFAVFAILLVLGTSANAGFLEDTYTGHIKPTFEGLVDKIKELSQHLSDKIKEHLLPLLEQLGIPHRRSLEFQQFFAQLKEKLGEKAELLKAYLQKLWGKLQVVAQKLLDGNIFHQPLETTIKELENAIADHNRHARSAIQDYLTAAIAQLHQYITTHVQQIAGQLSDKIMQLFDQGLQKRGITDFFQNIADFFQPHIDNAIQGITDLGNTLTNHVSNLWSTVFGSVQDLGDQLNVHVQTILDHGTQIHGHVMDAYEALKEAINDIVSQTFDNIKPHIDGITDTVQEGGNTIVDHVQG